MVTAELQAFQDWDGKPCPNGWFGWHRWRKVANLIGGSMFTSYEQHQCRKCRATKVVSFRYSD